MVEIKPAPIDFAIIFEGRCQIGWSNNLQPNVKTLVESPYNHLVVNVDEENLSQIIQRLCASAAFHTHTGSIHAKYEYRRGELIIAIDDTSNGLDKEMQAHVFDRFVNTNADSYYGTGLGMPIVKELVEQMGGVIDLTSEPGKGTTIWITIPCELIEMDKKREIPA
jgi:signal transduction histidine kinase